MKFSLQSNESDKKQLITVLLNMVENIKASERLIDYNFDQDTGIERMNQYGALSETVCTAGITKVKFSVVYK